MELYDIPCVKGFIRMCNDGWLQGWHERNGGNLTYRMTAEDVAACRPFFDAVPRERVKMGVQADNLAGEYFITTGSGKFFRNVEPDPIHSVGIVEINADGDNTTRFIVISRTRAAAGDRFSLLFTVEHKAGMLARVIQAIGAAGFNMESIKSRPKPGVPFEYYFYVELVGRTDSDSARALLKELENVCDTVRVLGVYSRSAKEERV